MLKIPVQYGGNAYNCTIIKITPSITLNKLNFIYNDDDYLKVLIKGFNNSIITNTSVNIEINGVLNTTLSTNSNGEIIMPTKNLSIGVYNLQVSFNGDDNYENTTIIQNFYIKKVPVQIIAKNKKFKAIKKNKKYTIFLKDGKKNPISKVKVSLKVKGKKYTVKSNKKGKVIFKLKKLNKKGKYKDIVAFKGDSIYNGVSKKIKLIIK